MKKLLVATVCLVVALSVSSCTDDANPAGVGRTMKGIMNLAGVSDSETPDCIIRVLSDTRWLNDSFSAEANPGVFGHQRKVTYCWLYTTDGMNFVNPTSAKCNGNLMDAMAEDGTPGQFQYTENNYLQTLNWNIDGYCGQDYSSIDSNAPEIVVSNLTYLDTVDLSQGININYTGSTNSETDSITFGISYRTMNASGYLETVNFDKRLPDNGTIVIPASELSNLPPVYKRTDGSRGVDGAVVIVRYSMEEEDFNGKTIAKLYETHWSAWMFFEN
jgi:hypothetical protein